VEYQAAYSQTLNGTFQQVCQYMASHTAV